MDNNLKSIPNKRKRKSLLQQSGSSIPQNNLTSVGNDTVGDAVQIVDSGVTYDLPETGPSTRSYGK